MFPQNMVLYGAWIVLNPHDSRWFLVKSSYPPPLTSDLGSLLLVKILLLQEGFLHCGEPDEECCNARLSRLGEVGLPEVHQNTGNGLSLSLSRSLSWLSDNFGPYDNFTQQEWIYIYMWYIYIYIPAKPVLLQFRVRIKIQIVSG